MSLLTLQRGMLDQILAEDFSGSPLPAGMAVYRHAYRARLREALQVRFDKTWSWMGDEAFAAAVDHHVSHNPPTSWTLDDYGETFVETLESLFTEAPEIAELAWLEWHMQRAFGAPNAATADASTLATGALADSDWEHIKFNLVPTVAVRLIQTNCAALWLALDNDEIPPGALRCDKQTYLMVWRKGLSPHYRVIERAEHAALSAAADGQSFGAICNALADNIGAKAAVEQLGTMLGVWLQDQLIADIA